MIFKMPLKITACSLKSEPYLSLFIPLFLASIFKNVLLIYNLHAKNSTHFQGTIQWLLVYLQSCATVTNIQFQSIFDSIKR